MPRLLQIRTLLLPLIFALTTTQAAVPTPPIVPPIAHRRAMSTAQIAQIVTAVLSLPATLARQGHPRAQGFQLIEHCIKLANTGLALVNQTDGFINVPWCFYDFVQSTRIIGALLSGSELSEASLEKLILAAAKIENQAPAPFTPEAKELAATEAASRHNQKIIGAVLATIEAGMRIAVALDKAQTGSLLQENFSASYRYILANIGSMARLADHYLYAATEERQKWLMGLLVLNAVAVGISVYQYKKFGPLIEEQRRNVAPIAQQRPLTEDAPAANIAFDHATFDASLGELVKDAGYLPLSADALAKRIDGFCTANHIAPFFDHATETGRRYHQHFMGFAQIRLLQDHNRIRQNTREFTNNFRVFVREQEAFLAPIRRRHPLPEPNAQPVVNGAFDHEAFCVCCRAFILQRQTFENADGFIAAFINFCEQLGIDNLFNEANPAHRRRREQFNTFWANRNHEWDHNPFQSHVRFMHNDIFDPPPAPQITTGLRDDSNTFTNAFRTYCTQADAQAQRQAH